MASSNTRSNLSRLHNTMTFSLFYPVTQHSTTEILKAKNLRTQRIDIERCAKKNQESGGEFSHLDADGGHRSV